VTAGAGGQGSSPDSRCRRQKDVSSQFRPVDLLILLDGSETMGIGYGAGTRYGAVASTLASLVDAYEGRVHFGFMQFPGDDAACSGWAMPGCCAEQPSIGVAPDTGAVIATALKRKPTLRGSSPVALALRTAGAYFQGRPPDGARRYVLLATDGMPSCTASGALSSSRSGRGDAAVSDACQDAIAEVKTLLGLGITTMVLAAGGDAADEPTGPPDCVGLLAKAGGMAQGRDGSPNGAGYYSLADSQGLMAAVRATFTDEEGPSCSFPLEWAPRSEVSVLLDGQPIPMDQTNGWAFVDSEPRQVILLGT
jgi:hypothetical protein